MRKALILGVSGQDGAYLARLLLDKGYEVWGTSRDAAGAHENLRRLGVLDRVKMLSVYLTDLASVLAALDQAQPDEIYNLAGQTSVSLSFQVPLETFHGIALGTLNLLEAMRLMKSEARLFHAGSSEAFGNAGEVRIDEETPLRPGSPYGVAKAAAHFQVQSYRRSFGLFACTGVLFNHESPLRPQKFVTSKVIAAVGKIARGNREKLHLGAVDVYRDWGWAPEYVEAMWRMLQQPEAEDFIIATGESNTLQDFVDAAFAAIGRSAKEFLELDGSLLRRTEIRYSYANPGKIERVLGWRAKNKMHDVVRLMLAADAEANGE